MFLHSGASLHGHEYSNKAAGSGNQPARRHILLRSSLGASPLQRSSFSTDETEPPTQRVNRRLSLQEPAAAARPVRRIRPVSDFVPRKDLVVRFEELPTVVGEEVHGLDGVSEDEGSLVSEISDTSTVIRSKRSRRAARQCTNYMLAYPPPKLRTKQRRFVSIRPRLLLQLQQLSNDKRPMPAIDVVPSSMIAGTVILPRLARRFPKMFRVKGQLGMNGLILAKSEDYDNNADDSDSDDKDLDKRDLVAVISPVSSRKEGERRDSGEQTEIVLADGSVWTATQTSNGSYDFVHIDEAGQTTIARWARRSARPLSTATCTAASTPAPSDYKFTFSILDPQLRRHPVMATLTPANLEILDNYTTVSQSSGRYPPTRPFSMDLSGDKEIPSPPTTSLGVTQRATHPVDEATRILITVTSVWVSLRHGQGWASSAASPIPGTSRPAQSRTVSGSSCQSRSSTFPVSATEMNRISSPPLVQQEIVTQPTSVVAPKRTFSSGAAFMQRRQTKLGGESVTTDNAAESDDLGALEKVPEPAPMKRSFSKRIRDWGHRFTSRKTVTA